MVQLDTPPQQVKLQILLATASRVHRYRRLDAPIG